MYKSGVFIKKSKGIIVVAVVLSFMLMSSVCTAKDTAEQSPAITVETQVPVITTLSKEVSFSTSLRPSNEITIIPKVGGTVTGIITDVGDYVEKDDVLFVIDDKDLSLQLEQAHSGLMTAQANYDMLIGAQLDQSLKAAESALTGAQIQLETAQTNYDNTVALFEAGAYSQQQLDASERQLRSAKLALESAQLTYNSTKDVIGPGSEQTASAALNQAQATYELMQSNVSNSLVKSPLSGYITQNNITDGMLVSQQTTAMVVSDISTLIANLSVTQNMISKLAAGQKVSVEIASASDKRIDGHIIALSPSANSVTGVFSVKVEIPNKDLLIKGGMFARIFVPTETVEDALTVPVSSVLHDDKGDYVYVDENSTSVRKDVTVGFTTDTRCEIKTGLTVKDMVIVKGQTYVSDGSSVVTAEELEAQRQATSAETSKEAAATNQDSTAKDTKKIDPQKQGSSTASGTSNADTTTNRNSNVG